MQNANFKEDILPKLSDTSSKEYWRKCMGIEPTREAVNPPHRI